MVKISPTPLQRDRLGSIMGDSAGYNDEGISYPVATERQQNRFVKLQW